MLFWPQPRSDECHFLSLELSTLCYALMNSIVPYTNQVLLLLEQLTRWTRDRVKLQPRSQGLSSYPGNEVVLLQSPYFIPPPHPHALNPITPTHRHFVLSPVSLVSRDQDGGPSDSTITSTISRPSCAVSALTLKLSFHGTTYIAFYPDFLSEECMTCPASHLQP